MIIDDENEKKKKLYKTIKRICLSHLYFIFGFVIRTLLFLENYVVNFINLKKMIDKLND